VEVEVTPYHYQFVILFQYLALAIWHGVSKNWASAGYWLSAAGITASVTWGMVK
jgi:hypothetical protein